MNTKCWKLDYCVNGAFAIWQIETFSLIVKFLLGEFLIHAFMHTVI
jgi:hypothetical protein